MVRARAGLGTLAHVLANSDPNMSAYYVLLHFWIRVFGETEVAVRSLSVLFAVLAVPATYLVGQRLLGRFAGFAAALLLTVNAFFVQYAQEARSYSLVLFLVTLSSYFFVVELERPSLVNRVGYVATSALAFYAHYFAAYVVLAQLVTLVVVRRRAALTKQWLAAAAAILLLCTPELVFAERAGADPIAWIGRPTMHELLAAAVDLAGGSRTLLLLFAASSCYAAGFALRRRKRWRYGFLIAWLLVPTLLSFALSFAQPMFDSRYVIVSLPALTLLGAAGLAEVRERLLAGSLLLLAVGLSGLHLADWYRRGSHEDWRNATKFVLAGMLPGDGIVLYPSYARKPFEYYERQDRASGPENLQGQDLRSAGKRRVWLVLRDSDAAARQEDVDRIELRLREQHRLIRQRALHRVSVRLYAARP